MRDRLNRIFLVKEVRNFQCPSVFGCLATKHVTNYLSLIYFNSQLSKEQ